MNLSNPFNVNFATDLSMGNAESLFIDAPNDFAHAKSEIAEVALVRIDHQNVNNDVPQHHFDTGSP